MRGTASRNTSRGTVGGVGNRPASLGGARGEKEKGGAMGLADRLRRLSGSDEHDTDQVDLVAAEEADTPAPAAPSTNLQFGRPTPCPQCGGRGYLDHLDMIDRIQYQHCTECGHRWEINEATILQQS